MNRWSVPPRSRRVRANQWQGKRPEPANSLFRASAPARCQMDHTRPSERWSKRKSLRVESERSGDDDTRFGGPSRARRYLTWEGGQAQAPIMEVISRSHQRHGVRHVLVPKVAVADPEPLRAEAVLSAKDCGLNPRQRWWSWPGDDWVFGLTAFLFTNYCTQNGIPFRMRE
jgi:hypothetical protein